MRKCRNKTRFNRLLCARHCCLDDISGSIRPCLKTNQTDIECSQNANVTNTKQKKKKIIDEQRNEKCIERAMAKSLVFFSLSFMCVELRIIYKF